ncbi:hypothetical protein M427DRAFT_377665 [Gonapodya prolifera JEL478]|uniref:Pentacotripeptide-repeat region of PRORP domain-containing protein n=1 Tax=Gonapodya prolifera (strain JEL478) TaxID=1344416 RepID=A0A139AUX8_GONPJ|nr:hypothetical protein M427DRAFT_377665 [Gonapodya prolifera JEL478]|eukprot:KXS20532.1 hypothetical protein M427DRAFT_377665 [Gonapodya prolifera JEL478]
MFAQLSAPLPNKHNSVIRNLLRLLLLRDQPPSALPLSFAILDSIPKPHSPSYLSYPLLSCATLGDTTTGLQLLDSQPPNNSSTRNLYSNFLHALYKRGHFSAIPDVWRAMVDRRVSPNLETCRTLLSWAADGVAASGISAHKAGLTVDRAWAIGVWETALEVSQELEQDENKGQRESPESHNKQNKLLRLPHTTPDKGIDLETQLTDLDEYTDLSSPLESSRWPLPLARDLLAHCYGHLVRLLLRLDHTAETHDWVNRVLVYHRRYPNRGVIPTPYLASIVVADAMRRSDAVGAMRWLDKFKEAGVQLNVHSVSALVKAFCEADDPEGGERTIMESRARWGVHPTGECISPLITYYAMRRDGEAVRRMETLVTTLAIPASPSLYGHKLVTLMSKGEDAAAIEEIKAMRASRVEPDADLLVSLARVGPARKGDIDKARRLVPLSRPQDALAVELEAWAARAKLGADRSEVWRRINVVLEEAKRRELKIPLYGRQAVVEAIGGSDEVVGDNGMLLAECMSHHILNRKPRAALSAFDSFTLRNPTAEVPPQAWSWRLRAYHLLDQPVQLRRTWQQMVQENKTSAKSWRTWGLFNAMEGSRRGALEAENALSVLKTDSNLANAQYSPFDDIRFHQRLNVAQAVAYHNLGDLPSATSHIEQSVHFASQSENRVLGAELNRVLLAIAEATYNKRQLSGGLELWLRTFRILKRWDLVTEIMSMIEKRPDGMVRRRYLVTRTMLMIRKRPKGKVKESNNN